ncbi:MAG: hypothetical protein JEZ11_08315 [Desulfobacterales bacterium]|nr:hypothetical protein [Desulfobacterales bacterium]
MKQTVEKMASLQLTAVLLILLLVWFAAGGILAVSDGCAGAFDAMNRQLLRDWMMANGRWPWAANAWMFGLFAVMGVLGINLGCCVWRKMTGMVRSGRPVASRLMLVLHLAFGVLILLHLGSFMLGYRQEGIRLKPGKTMSLPDGSQLRLDRVHFVDNPDVLALSFRKLTRENFSFDENHAWVTLSKNGRDLFSGPAGIMRPLRWGDTQVTLKKFKPARGGRQGGASPAGFGAVMVVTKNPCLRPILVFFPILIVSTAVYLVLTWRTKHFN